MCLRKLGSLLVSFGKFCLLYLSSLLIRAGANLNSVDNDGWTPLHAAAHWDKHDVMKYLVERHANLDLKNYAVMELIVMSVYNSFFRVKHHWMYAMAKHFNC
jgi:ankyrin repeat protein